MGDSLLTPTLAEPRGAVEKRPSFAWATIAWVSLLLGVYYTPVLMALVRQWWGDADMGHAFAVPVFAAYIAWKKRDQLAGIAPEPNWWGLAVMLWAGLQLYIGTLGAELFLTRTSLVISIIGAVLLLGGTKYLKIFKFPLFLLFFMVPIPAVLYNQITFPLQILASQVAEN